MSEAPDRLGYWVGWKGLLADDAGNLYSPRGNKWPRRKPLIAKCSDRPLEAEHMPPHPGCMCGIYAVKSFDDLKSHNYNWQEEVDGKVWVVVEIAMYGKYVKGAIGFKTGKAKVLKVYVPATKIRLGGLIKQRYDVDLGLIDRFTGKVT